LQPRQQQQQPQHMISSSTCCSTPARTTSGTSRTTRLKRLVLSVRLVGDALAFSNLAHCLERQHALRHVSWEEWCFPTTEHGNDAASFEFNPLVAALAKLPHLVSLSIKAMTAGSRRANLGTLSPSTMTALGNHETLQQLQLVHFQLSNIAVQALATSLQRNTNTTLQRLSLDLSKTNAQGAIQLFDALGNNNSTLTDLRLWASTTHPGWGEDCLYHLAQVLQKKNTTVHSSSSSLVSLEVLTHSRTLQEAVQNLTVVNHGIATAFVRMLETNCTLQHLVLDDYYNDDDDSSNGDDSSISSRLTAIMSFYLALNGSKRRQHLLQQYDTYTRSDWTDLLTMAVQSDREIRLEAVYYFLRLNPSLCQV
jgi:hypothetical protein